MSGLVSYGSSDESESSDGEDSPPVEAKPKEVHAKAQGVDEPSSSVPKKSSLFASLPKPKGISTPALEEVKSAAPRVGLDLKDEEGSRKKSLFTSLPPPKKTAVTAPNAAEPTPGAKDRPTLVTGSSSATDSTVSKGLLNLPPPKKKQPVKISLPALPDPDSDDDEPETKRPKSTKGAGLFAMLPKPKTMSRKEAQRPLIPYTLTKKPAAAPAKPPGKTPGKPPLQPPAQSAKPTQLNASTAVVNKPAGGNPLVTGYNSDEDDEDDDSGGVNFFSMGESDSVKERTTGESVAGPHAQSTNKPLATDLSNVSNKESGRGDALETESGNGTDRTSSGTGPGVQTAPGVVKPLIPSNQDQPLVFNASKSNSSGYSVPNYSHHHAMYNLQYNEQSSQGVSYAQPSDGSMPYGSYSQTGLDSQNASDSMQYYNQPYQEGSDTGYDQNETNAQSSSQSFLQDERFAKMVGKNNRGKEEIQFIDINADDQIGPTAGLQQMVKSMTEEKEYRGKLKKEQLPTSQQKRKHQITYLARQAKERELELKNQWAENRQNRKSTNAKYGFF